MTFSDWLRDELSRRDLTARRFAAKMGVSNVSVNKWIAGTDYPRRSRLVKMAEVLGLPENVVWEAWREREGEADTIAQIIAREIPDGLTPFEARLVGRLVRKTIEAVQEWGEAEEERDEELFRDAGGSSAAAARRAGRTRALQARLLEQG